MKLWTELNVYLATAFLANALEFTFSFRKWVPIHVSVLLKKKDFIINKIQ